MVVEAIDALKHEALLQDLAQNMRGQDRAECEDLNLCAYDALLECVISSELCFIISDGQGALWAFGATPSGCAWLLGAKNADKYKKTMAKLSKGITRLLIGHYGRLYNRAPAAYTKTIRWLGWLGAKFGVKETVNGREYLHFTLGGE